MTLITHKPFGGTFNPERRGILAGILAFVFMQCRHRNMSIPRSIRCKDFQIVGPFRTCMDCGKRHDIDNAKLDVDAEIMLHGGQSSNPGTITVLKSV